MRFSAMKNPLPCEIISSCSLKTRRVTTEGLILLTSSTVASSSPRAGIHVPIANSMSVGITHKRNFRMIPLPSAARRTCAELPNRIPPAVFRTAEYHDYRLILLKKEDFIRLCDLFLCQWIHLRDDTPRYRPEYGCGCCMNYTKRMPINFYPIHSHDDMTLPDNP